MSRVPTPSSHFESPSPSEMYEGSVEGRGAAAPWVRRMMSSSRCRRDRISVLLPVPVPALGLAGQPGCKYVVCACTGLVVIGDAMDEVVGSIRYARSQVTPRLTQLEQGWSRLHFNFMDRQS